MFALSVVWVLTHTNVLCALKVCQSGETLSGLAWLFADLAWVKTHATVGGGRLLQHVHSSGFALPVASNPKSERGRRH